MTDESFPLAKGWLLVAGSVPTVSDLSEAPAPTDPNRALRAELDYERTKHRETMNLALQKENEKQGAILERDAAQRTSEGLQDALSLVRDLRAQELWALRALSAKGGELADLLQLCMPIVRDLFESTDSRSVYNSCQEIIARYEELLHVPTSEPRRPAHDPDDVGYAGIRHVSDCQGERPQGVGGGELSGEAGEQKNRATQYINPNYWLGPSKWYESCAITDTLGKKNK